MDAKPSRNEDEYFAKQDAELIKEHRAKLDAVERAAKRAQHHMKCPKCGADLVEKSLGHVKIDVCPDCHGTWLDAGELELVARVKDGAAAVFIRDLLKGLRSK